MQKREFFLNHKMWQTDCDAFLNVSQIMIIIIIIIIILISSKVRIIFTHRWRVMCLSVRVTIYMCVSAPRSLSLTHTAWHKRRGGGGGGGGWGWGGDEGGWVGGNGGVTHRAAMNMTPRYSIVGPCPVLRTFDSISVSGINVSLGSTFWIIGAVCRHPATSCQQHRLSICLSVRPSYRTPLLMHLHYRKQAVRAREHLILFFLLLLPNRSHNYPIIII